MVMQNWQPVWASWRRHASIRSRPVRVGTFLHPHQAGERPDFPAEQSPPGAPRAAKMLTVFLDGGRAQRKEPRNLHFSGGASGSGGGCAGERFPTWTRLCQEVISGSENLSIDFPGYLEQRKDLHPSLFPEKKKNIFFWFLFVFVPI